MKEGKRSERVGDLIHKEISEMLVKSIKDPRIGFVTITRVSVSEDFRLAKVYYSVLGSLTDREKSKKGLDSATGFIRKELGRRMRLRYTPEITFQFDPGIEYAVHIGEVLHHLHQGEKKEDEDGDGD